MGEQGLLFVTRYRISGTLDPVQTHKMWPPCAGAFQLTRTSSSSSSSSSYQAAFTTSNTVFQVSVSLSKTQNPNRRSSFVWESLDPVRWPNPHSNDRRSAKSFAAGFLQAFLLSRRDCDIDLVGTPLVGVGTSKLLWEAFYHWAETHATPHEDTST